MSKYLITGGSGFIGTSLIKVLLEQGASILNIDIVQPKIQEHNSYWRKIDITELEPVQEAVEVFQPDYVIHLAARTDLNGVSLQDYDVNIGGVTNVLKSLDIVPNLKRVIFTSSMYVCQPGYQPTNFEDYRPHTVYGESKVMTEKIIKEYNPKYCWSIIRPTSIWGPYFGEPYNLFFKIVLGRKYFHMGDQACSKTYGYIDNTIYQILSILFTEQDEKVLNKVFYLGDYEPYDITEWSNEIAYEAGFKIPRIPYFVFKLGGWFGDFLKTLGIKFSMTSFRLKNMTTDNIHDTRLIEDIAPNLPISRKDGIRQTINWLRTN